MSHSLIPEGTRRDGPFVFLAIIVLEIADFVCMVMEPFFKWLPLLGLLYVLVPYYNQVAEDYDEEEDEWNDEEIDYSQIDWNR